MECVAVCIIYETLLYIQMDIMRLVHNDLSDEDIGTVLGADATNIRHSELRHIYMTWMTC